MFFRTEYGNEVEAKAFGYLFRSQRLPEIIAIGDPSCLTNSTITRTEFITSSRPSRAVCAPGCSGFKILNDAFTKYMFAMKRKKPGESLDEFSCSWES